MTDPVNHPPHDTAHPSGVECITVARHFGFNLGNVLKYIWRTDLKGADIEDLQKASFYLNDEIERRINAQLKTAKTKPNLFFRGLPFASEEAAKEYFQRSNERIAAAQL